MGAYKKRFERGEPQHPLTPRMLKLLLYIAECRLLTHPQLVRLTRRSDKAVRDHLRNLFDLGLVQRAAVPPSAFAAIDAPNDHTLLYGSAPLLYTLSREGASLLVRQGLATKEGVADIPQYGPLNYLFLAHEVAVRDVRVWLQGVAGQYGVPGVEEWCDGTRAAIGPARPDAWFRFRFCEKALVGFVEVDRGTERKPATWAEKVTDYQKLFHSGLIPQVTGQKSGRVLVLTPNAKRRDAIAEIIGKETVGADLPPDRFWLAEKAVLAENEVRTAVWRVAGHEGLWPLVEADVL